MKLKNLKQSFLHTAITGVLLLCGLGSWGQSPEPSSLKSKVPPVIFINSQRVNYPITYLDADNVATISVVRDTVNKAGGFIYITTKNLYRPPLTLADITHAQIGLESKKVLYMIDGSVVFDTTNIRMDSSVIVDEQVVHSADISYLGSKQEPFDILLISTKNKFNQPQKGEKQIRLQ